MEHFLGMVLVTITKNVTFSYVHITGMSVEILFSFIYISLPLGKIYVNFIAFCVYKLDDQSKTDLILALSIYDVVL